MNEVKLTARQILTIDNLSQTEKAQKEALQVALNYLSNQNVEIQRQWQIFWDEMHEILGTDKGKDKLEMKQENGTVVVKRVEVKK